MRKIKKDSRVYLNSRFTCQRFEKVELEIKDRGGMGTLCKIMTERREIFIISPLLQLLGIQPKLAKFVSFLSILKLCEGGGERGTEGKGYL